MAASYRLRNPARRKCLHRARLYASSIEQKRKATSPRNAYGKREAHNIYAKTREECEEKLAAMIAQVKADIEAEKERLKTVNESFSLET